MTFHIGEQNELEDVTKNTEPKTIQPIRNYPPELQRIKIKLKIPREPIWDPIGKTLFAAMKSLWQVHMLEKTKLINYKGKLMN